MTDDFISPYLTKKRRTFLEAAFELNRGREYSELQRIVGERNQAIESVPKQVVDV